MIDSFAETVVDADAGIALLIKPDLTITVTIDNNINNDNLNPNVDENQSDNNDDNNSNSESSVNAGYDDDDDEGGGIKGDDIPTGKIKRGRSHQNNVAG
jgi:hypothetical protein